MIGWSGGHDHLPSSSDREAPVGVEFDGPAFGLQPVMVMPAQWEQVGEVGGTAVFPEHEMMRLGGGHVPVAAGDRTRPIHRPERTPLPR